MEIEEITLYVDMEMKDGWGDIQLYPQLEGGRPVSGKITIGKSGGVITFLPRSKGAPSWTFWNLTVHPLGGADRDRADDGAAIGVARARPGGAQPPRNPHLFRPRRRGHGPGRATVRSRRSLLRTTMRRTQPAPPV